MTTKALPILLLVDLEHFNVWRTGKTFVDGLEFCQFPCYYDRLNFVFVSFPFIGNPQEPMRNKDEVFFILILLHMSNVLLIKRHVNN